jgi:hypothetical protein
MPQEDAVATSKPSAADERGPAEGRDAHGIASHDKAQPKAAR